MRKIITIPIIILILFSGVTINLAFHYCGGQIAEKKILLTDTPGSCGMEGDVQHKKAGMKSLCCEDRVFSYTFNNIFAGKFKTEEKVYNALPGCCKYDRNGTEGAAD